MALHRPNIPAILIGHSFVRRLYNYIEKASETDPVIHKNFGLENVNILFDHKGGRLVSGLLDNNLEQKLKRIAPKIAILQIGGNDIANGTRPETVASMIEDIVQELHFNYRIKYIIVCQLIYRQTGPVDYNTNVDLCNKILKEIVTVHKFAYFWKHVGIEHSVWNLYARDRVHFNDIGHRKLYKSYRRALIFADHNSKV